MKTNHRSIYTTAPATVVLNAFADVTVLTMSRLVMPDEEVMCEFGTLHEAVDFVAELDGAGAITQFDVY